MADLLKVMNNFSIVIITGLSGAGKSHVKKVFEDFGYYSIDNVPLQILDKTIELFYSEITGIDKVAFVIDSRATKNESVFSYIKNLRDKYNALTIYMDSSIETLIKRYKETRRKHPLGTEIHEAIIEEIDLMQEVKTISNIVINTDGKTIHDLTADVKTLLNLKSDRMAVRIQSFGFKYGVPSDADLMFDVRFLRNPHFDDGLRTLTGLNDEIKEYVKVDKDYEPFINNLNTLLQHVIPLYEKEGKMYLNISIGCTGGKHRSVTVVEELAKIFKSKNIQFTIKHRDIEK